MIRRLIVALRYELQRPFERNKTYAELGEAQAAKSTASSKKNDIVVSAAPPRTFSYADATKPVPENSNPDAEQQAKTGDLAGAPKATAGGLSTFAVDNSTGERDAVVRLYLGGKKPAARSVYIKLGENSRPSLWRLGATSCVTDS